MNRQAPDLSPWTAKQDLAATSLAGGATVVVAARAAGVAERTVHSWLANPSFKAHVAKVRAEVLGRISGAMTRNATKAQGVLRKLLDSDNEATRLRAAVAIMDSVLKLGSHVELAARVAEIEAAMTRSTGRRRIS